MEDKELEAELRRGIMAQDKMLCLMAWVVELLEGYAEKLGGSKEDFADYAKAKGLNPAQLSCLQMFKHLTK